jgi:hypothetical protein
MDGPSAWGLGEGANYSSPYEIVFLGNVTYGLGIGGLFWTLSWTFGFLKRREISWLSEWLLASQEGICSMVLWRFLNGRPGRDSSISYHKSHITTDGYPPKFLKRVLSKSQKQNPWRFRGGIVLPGILEKSQRIGKEIRCANSIQFTSNAMWNTHRRDQKMIHRNQRMHAEPTASHSIAERNI